MQSNNLNSSAIPMQLPTTGLKRAKDILPFLPIKRSTLWKWVSEGKFPKPVRISGITCWTCESIHDWLALHGIQHPTVANDD